MKIRHPMTLHHPVPCYHRLCACVHAWCSRMVFVTNLCVEFVTHSYVEFVTEYVWVDEIISRVRDLFIH